MAGEIPDFWESIRQAQLGAVHEFIRQVWARTDEIRPTLEPRDPVFALATAFEELAGQYKETE